MIVEISRRSLLLVEKEISHVSQEKDIAKEYVNIGPVGILL